MSKVIYICEGTCKGEATLEQFEGAGGVLKCQTEDCDKHAQDLTKLFVCEKCSERSKEEEHTCKEE